MKNRITIGLCGAQPRIGTTTQAIQFIKYIETLGFRAAYISFSSSGEASEYIDKLCKLYAGVKKTEKKVTFEGVSLFRSITDFQTDEEADEYTFLIKDYGSYSGEEDFNTESFSEQDIKIVCCGAKPNEIFKMDAILRKKEFNNAAFIFSFVPPEMKEPVKRQMTNRAEKTFFAGYTPDLFSYDPVNTKLYRQILGEKLTQYRTDEHKGSGKLGIMIREMIRKIRECRNLKVAAATLIFAVYTAALIYFV